jgi:hypothetical protein
MFALCFCSITDSCKWWFLISVIQTKCACRLAFFSHQISNSAFSWMSTVITFIRVSLCIYFPLMFTVQFMICTWDRIVIRVTGLHAEQLRPPGLISGMVKRFFFLQSLYFGCEGVPSHLLSGYQGLLPKGKSPEAWSWLSIHVVPKFRMSGGIISVSCLYGMYGISFQSFLPRTWCVCHCKVRSCQMILKSQNTKSNFLAAYSNQNSVIWTNGHVSGTSVSALCNLE